MPVSTLTIPKKTIYDILKSQPDDVLIELFEELMVDFDTAPLNDEEKLLIREAKQEYADEKTIEIEI